MEEKEVYLDPHCRPRSQIDFRWMKFKTKSTFRNYEIKVNLYQLYGERSELEDMTRGVGIIHLYQNKSFSTVNNRWGHIECSYIRIKALC